MSNKYFVYTERDVKYLFGCFIVNEGINANGIQTVVFKREPKEMRKPRTGNADTYSTANIEDRRFFRIVTDSIASTLDKNDIPIMCVISDNTMLKRWPGGKKKITMVMAYATKRSADELVVVGYAVDPLLIDKQVRGESHEF